MSVAEKIQALPTYERGIAELEKWLQVARTSSDSLKEAEVRLEALHEDLVQQMIALVMQQLKEGMDLANVANKFRHVEEHLLRPVIDDADYLKQFLGIDPTRLRLLVVLHDLGKVEIPGELFEALNHIFPDDFVAREILTHEFASMHWIAKLGKALKIDDKTVFGLQQLIANHNFGPNLTLDRHKHLRNNWWPARFREKMFPKFLELKIDLAKLYDKDTEGTFQYYHTEDSVYACLLSVYDRAIASRFNTYGLQTWQKFAEQDYHAWQSLIKTQPEAPTPLKATLLTEKMELAAGWAETEIEAIWAILNEKYVRPEMKKIFQLENFHPYQKQKDANQKLLAAIGRVKTANLSEKPGRLLYRARDNSLYRVDDRSHAPPERKAKLYWWDGVTYDWQQIAEDHSPIKLYFEIIQGDL